MEPSFIEEQNQNRHSIAAFGHNGIWTHLPPPPPNATDNDIKRRLIVQSLVKSEKSYISSLETIENDYRKRLHSNKLVEPNLVDQMFGAIEPILGTDSYHKLRLWSIIV